jgi:hypothetical protein
VDIEPINSPIVAHPEAIQKQLFLFLRRIKIIAHAVELLNFKQKEAKEAKGESLNCVILFSCEFRTI